MASRAFLSFSAVVANGIGDDSASFRAFGFREDETFTRALSSKSASFETSPSAEARTRAASRLQGASQQKTIRPISRMIFSRAYASVAAHSRRTSASAVWIVSSVGAESSAFD